MLRGSQGSCNPTAPQIQRNAATATFPPTSTDPQHCEGSHSGIVTAQTAKNRCKLNNSALGRRHLGLCPPCTMCHACQLTHSSTATVAMGRPAPTRCLIMLP